MSAWDRDRPVDKDGSRPGADFRMLPSKRTLSRRRFLHRDAWRVSGAIDLALG